MKIQYILGITYMVVILGADTAASQMAHTMTFTTGSTGHHQSESTQLQTSKDQFFGIAVSRDEDRKPTQQVSSNVQEVKDDSYTYTADNYSNLNIEYGHSTRTTQVNQKESFDFSVYNFDYSIDFIF